MRREHDEVQADAAVAPAQAAAPAAMGAGPLAYVLQLQRTMGNQGVAQLLRQTQAPPAPAGGDTVEAAAATIRGLLMYDFTAPKREQLLSTLLLNHHRAAELRAAYEKAHQRKLDDDLANVPTAADALRALDSLDYGELRPMSKVFIAIVGEGTDTTTLWRVLKECHAAAPAGDGIARFETMWSAVTESLPGRFSGFQGETLASALDGDLDGYELVKAHATLAYGELRPIDKVYIATVQAGTDEALLFEGLARCNRETIEADFSGYAFRGVAFDDNAVSIWDTLDSELSGEDYRRALALLDREPNPEYGMFAASGTPKVKRLGGNQRLVALVKAAVHGAGTNVELIMSAVDEATQAEREALKTQVEDPKDPLGLVGTWGDLSSGELARLRAKLGIKESGPDAAGIATDAQLADPTVMMLRGLGGVDMETVFDTLKLSAGGTWGRFKAEFEKGGQFESYVTANTTAIEKGHLYSAIFSTNLDTRLDFCFGVFTDDEDYLFHLLGNFAANADKRRLAADGAFMDKLRGNLSSSEMARAITLLKPSDLSAVENAKWISQAVERAHSGFFDFFSSTGAALDDENRELQAGTTLSELDQNISPEEKRLLEARGARTQAAMDDYTAARDEFANTASMVANVAVSVIVAALTGGAAGPIVLAQLARAAAAMAVAKVLTEKVIRGDNFDIIGSDGAVAFATGAVDGVMNVSGGLLAKGVAGAGLEAVGLSAQKAAGSLFRGAARSGLLAVTEGGMAGASSSFVDTMARDETWREGILEGLEKVAENTAAGGAMGAGMSLSMHAALAGLRVAVGQGEHLPLGHADNPLVASALKGDEVSLVKIVNRMGRWEDGIGALQRGGGMWEGLADAARAELLEKLVAHRKAIADMLAERFGAKVIGDASTSPGSDVDLNVQGDNAGQKLLEAEQYMDSGYPNWRQKYRMGLLVDASRIGTLEEVIASLPPDAQARVRARVTKEAATLIFARRLHLAEAAERAAMEAEPPAGVDVARAKQIADLDEAGRLEMRNAALREGDKAVAEMKAATDPAVKQQLAEKVTFQQMLANTMDDEAYLSGGGVKGFALGKQLTNVFEQYQALLDQIGMIAHVVHESGGVLEAARRYELFKYVHRICVLFEQAGIEDERLAFFKNWSDLVYRVDRDATGALDRPGGAPLNEGAHKAGVRTDAEAPKPKVSDEFLLENYGRFSEMVEQHGMELGKKAQAEGGGPDAAGKPTGAPQLVRLPRPSPAETAGGGGGHSPAIPGRVAGDEAALLQRLIKSKGTLEQEIADTEAFPAQKAAAQRALDEIRAKPFRELTPADLMVSATVQRTLFESAGAAVERMKAFAARMLGGADAEIISIRKREDLDGFIGGILEKCGRKDYPILGQMDDIIRGRLNITEGADVARTAQAMRAQSDFRVTHVEEPRTNAAGVTRYPRYHVIVEDPSTGLTHEWQIGTRATSELYETKGIVIPDELAAAAKNLNKHFRPDIHDIEYDIFQAFNKREPGVAAELGIPAFIAKVAEASQESGAGAAYTQLGVDIKTLHTEAGQILQALVERKGGDYVARLLH